MTEENVHYNSSNIDPEKLVKRVRKSRKLRQGRRKQSVLRGFVRFSMTIVMAFLFVYVSKMSQWYLPKEAFTAPNGIIRIDNNNIIRADRIYGVLQHNKINNVPIYMMRTGNMEKEIKKLNPIEDVYIRRYAFPARLHIIVKERVPVISLYTGETSSTVGAYTKEGVFLGREFMPIPSDIKTIKVLASEGGEFGYSKWTKDDINKILSIVNNLETYTKEPVEYFDMRNPADVYAKIKTVKIRIGKLDGTVYERIQRIPSIIPQIKLMRSKVQYLDISWEKVNYLKLYK